MGIAHSGSTFLGLKGTPFVSDFLEVISCCRRSDSHASRVFFWAALMTAFN